MRRINLSVRREFLTPTRDYGLEEKYFCSDFEMDELSKVHSGLKAGLQ